VAIYKYWWKRPYHLSLLLISAWHFLFWNLDLPLISIVSIWGRFRRDREAVYQRKKKGNAVIFSILGVKTTKPTQNKKFNFCNLDPQTRTQMGGGEREKYVSVGRWVQTEGRTFGSLFGWYDFDCSWPTHRGFYIDVLMLFFSRFFLVPEFVGVEVSNISLLRYPGIESRKIQSPLVSITRIANERKMLSLRKSLWPFHLRRIRLKARKLCNLLSSLWVSVRPCWNAIGGQ